MTKRLNSKHKIDRRLKVNLWGRPKSPFNKRAYPPGQHGQSKNAKLSHYGTQLQAKQKLKSYYGNVRLENRVKFTASNGMKIYATIEH